MYTSDNQDMTDDRIEGTEILGVLSGLDEGLYNMFKEYDFNEEEKAIYRLGEELIKAVVDDNIIEVKRLLDMGINVDSQDNKGNTALITASNKGHCDILEMLLKAKADVNIQNNEGFTALMYASQNKKKDILTKLLEVKGIEVNNANNYSKWTALMCASISGKIQNVQLLLDVEEIDVDLQDRYGNTALTLASKFRHPNIVEILKSHKEKNNK